MKWLLFTSASVAALIGLGLLAVDERDVIWEGRKAVCGYCRAELAYYSVVCRECDRSLDWRTHQEECRWCLDRSDVDELLDLYRGLVAAGPLPAALGGYEAYLGAIEVGECTYCGGVGRVVEAAQEKDCPVCRGGKKCIACGGSRSVVIGDESARRSALEREDTRVRAQERAVVAGLPLNLDLVVDEDVAALRGYREAEDLTDAAGRKLLDQARAQILGVFHALHGERERRAKQQRGS
jgi:hypothetical protein